jgi:hypothetical protein
MRFGHRVRFDFELGSPLSTSRLSGTLNRMLVLILVGGRMQTDDGLPGYPPRTTGQLTID